jgi:phage terminase small subunit
MLNTRQKKFVLEYCKSLNAAQAAIKAGYSEKTARAIGSRLLTDVNIQQEISLKQNKTMGKLEVSVDRIMLERARLAFFDPRKLLDSTGRPRPLHELDDDTAACIAGLKVQDRYEQAQDGSNERNLSTVLEYKLADKNASLTALEKINGMYSSGYEPSGLINIHLHL